MFENENLVHKITFINMLEIPEYINKYLNKNVLMCIKSFNLKYQ